LAISRYNHGLPASDSGRESGLAKKGEFFRSPYIERDLKELVKVRDLVAFRRFLSAAAGRAGQLVNFTDLGRSCGASPNTARAWVAALQVSGILYLLHPWFSNPETRLVKSPKLYFADTGLLCALLAIDDPEALDHSPHAGAVWENCRRPAGKVAGAC
jgi:predicted AAA+ superfamily ATPase